MRIAVFTLLTWIGLLAACSTTYSPFPKTEEHIVGSGDTLYSIAFEYDLDYRDLARWNGINRPYKIYTGQMLVLHPYHPLARNSVYESESEQKAEKTRGNKVATKPLETRSSGSVREIEVKPVTPLPPPVATSTERVVQVTPGQQASEEATADVPQEVMPAEPAVPPPEQVAKAEPVVATPSYKQTVIPEYDDPWIWPIQGKVLDAFSGTNKGLDIAGQPGSPIRATSGGKVVYAGEGLKGYGLLLIIKHDDTYLSAYGHNERLLVVQGESVKQGQHIATVGRGPENQPMVHFEIRRNGKPVDPSTLLPK